MRRLRWVAPALVAIAAVAVSQAAGETSSAAPSYKDCLRHATTTVAMESCIKTERTRLAAALTAAYDRVVARPELGSRRTAQLAAAQRAWKRYERLDCNFNGSLVSGGTLEPVTVGECLVARETERLAELRVYTHFPD
jgi:uncharacterized protein YecT (DUF1311 family)